MEKSLVVVTIGDIHFGAMDSKILLKELREEFLNRLKEMPIIDLIVITGDLYDHKLSLNSTHTKSCFSFIRELCDIVIMKNAAVRVIKGTLSHDNDQLDNLNMFADMCDFKIINSLVGEFFRGSNILYMPEEYLDDDSLYYDEWADTTWDLIFGHGMIKDAAFIAHKQESAITMKKAIILKTEKLLDACKGVIMFGHIHTAGKYRKRFYYGGSFSRWCFGEEEDKGFNIIYYNSEYPERVKVEFMVNKQARIFDTVTLDIRSSDVEQVCSTIKNAIDVSVYDKKRVIVNLSEDIPNARLMSSMITEIFGKYENIKLVINSLAKEQIRRNNDEKVERLFEEFGFIFDKALSKEEKIYRYINKKYNRNIPVDKIRDYLFNKIVE